MQKRKKILVWSLALIFSYTSIFPASVWAGDLYKPFRLLAQPFKAKHREEPATCEVPAIEQLANQIDWLEHYIDDYGTIVAKHPDVWGESRLARHRDEYEREMAKELTKFSVTMNASLRRSDQAFLGMAMALQSATKDQQGLLDRATESKAAEANIVNILKITEEEDFTRTNLFKAPVTAGGFEFEKSGVSLEPTIQLNQRSRYLQHLNHLRRINEGDDTADSPGYALNLVRIPVSVIPGKKTRTGYGAEITITAEPYLTDSLLPTTFRNMVVNDLVDQLSLPLVRLVDVLPELERLQKEIAKKKEDSLKMKESANQSRKAASELREAAEAAQRAKQKAIEKIEQAKEEGKEEETKGLDNRGPDQKAADKAKAEYFEVQTELWETLRQHKKIVADLPEEENYSPISDNFDKAAFLFDKLEKQYQEEIDKNESMQSNMLANAIAQTGAMSIRSRVAPNALPPTQIMGVLGADELMAVAYKLKNLRGYPQDSNRNSDCILSKLNFQQSLKQNLQNVICPSPPSGPTIHFHDARQFIQAETSAAYDLLKVLDEGTFLIRHVTGLAEAIRANDMASVAKRRAYFFVNLHLCKKGPDALKDKGFQTADNLTEILAWAIVVEAALLNQRLIRDINEAAGAKGCGCMATEDMKFYLFEPRPQKQLDDGLPVPFASKKTDAPRMRNVLRERPMQGRQVAYTSEKELPELIPAGQHATSGTEISTLSPILLDDTNLQEIEGIPAGKRVFRVSPIVCDPVCEFQRATRVFQEYVKCRWPIRVFALDPVTQEQNVADAFARRRELQVAMSLAFASGQMSGQALMRFARRLEWDMATIALNRTAIAFSHGSDTFGWRFRPRFQTPPIKGNLATLSESIFGGPTRDQDLKERQLEPGMRECTAIVVMPSFVPYATFDVRTNWYKLTNPKCTELSMRETMRLSRAIQTMKNSAASCSRCAHLYRDGEVQRLFRRVNQLDKELPLQSMMVQIPYENTLGGFEMFNRGITDLSPEIIGWYGAIGINLRGPTRLFLVGDGFSVLGNQVIAGGQEVPCKLISRQVMEVIIPSGVQRYQEGNKSSVDIYMATPYGVSRRLMIPIDENSMALNPQVSLKNNVDITFRFNKNDAGQKTIQDYYGVPWDGLTLLTSNVPLPDNNITVRFELFDKLSNTAWIPLGAVDGTFSLNKNREYQLTGDALKKIISTDAGSFQKCLQKYLEYLYKNKIEGRPVEVMVRGKITSVTPAVPISQSIPIILEENKTNNANPQSSVSE